MVVWASSMAALDKGTDPPALHFGRAPRVPDILGAGAVFFGNGFAQYLAHLR